MSEVEETWKKVAVSKCSKSSSGCYQPSAGISATSRKPSWPYGAFAPSCSHRAVEVVACGDEPDHVFMRSCDEAALSLRTSDDSRSES